MEQVGDIDRVQRRPVGFGEDEPGLDPPVPRHGRLGLALDMVEEPAGVLAVQTMT